MNLRTFCEERDLTLGALAARIGMHRAHLHKIATGERGWSCKTALAIEDGTRGLVTPNDLAATRRRFLRRAKAKQGRARRAKQRRRAA